MSSTVILAMLSQISQVTDSLYISSCYVLKAERLRQLGISFVVNCTVEVPSVRDPQISTVQIHIEDTPFANLRMYFDRITDRIADTIARGGKVLVHCVAGVSRSATIVLAYLMKHRRMTLKEAYYFLKQKRPIIHPNVGFWKQLIQFEVKLFGAATVRIVDSAFGAVPEVYLEEPRNLPWASAPNAFPGLTHASSMPALNVNPINGPMSRDSKTFTQKNLRTSETRTKEPSAASVVAALAASRRVSANRAAQPQPQTLPADVNARNLRLRASYSPNVPSNLSVIGRSKTAQKSLGTPSTPPRNPNGHARVGSLS